MVVYTTFKTVDLELIRAGLAGTGVPKKMAKNDVLPQAFPISPSYQI